MSNFNKLSSDELLSLIKIGDERAFTEVYNRYWRLLYAIAYNRLKDLEEVEDIVHDVLASLWTNREKLEINNLKSYLATAVKFRIFATIRKQNSRQTFQEQMLIPDPVDSYDVLDAMHYKKIIDAVNNEIENLPEKCKIVFKCSREQSMSVKQIALHLNISSSTVENHLNKALKKLNTVAKNLKTNILLLLF